MGYMMIISDQLCVTKDVLSDYCPSILDEYQISVGEVEKLIPTCITRQIILLIILIQN